MRLPSKVRIKSRISYNLFWTTDLGHEGDEPITGECCEQTRQIRILSGQSDDETMKTFIHEVLHCLEFEYDIELPHKAINQLESAILKVLKLNKWLK
jgi:hypothetical protein